jgi:hypothetical protein
MRYMNKDWKEVCIARRSFACPHPLTPRTPPAQAAKINLILCFMPIPFGSHPYLFALSAVPFDQFVLVFVVGMIPSTVLNLLIGQALEEATAPEVRLAAAAAAAADSPPAPLDAPAPLPNPPHPTQPNPTPPHPTPTPPRAVRPPCQ